MSNQVEFFFEYPHPKLGNVHVCATFLLEKPDFYSRESDFDYNGLQELAHYEVAQGGKQIFVDIPEDVLYHELRNYLRDFEISACFNQENGGF